MGDYDEPAGQRRDRDLTATACVDRTSPRPMRWTEFMTAHRAVGCLGERMSKQAPALVCDSTVARALPTIAHARR